MAHGTVAWPTGPSGEAPFSWGGSGGAATPRPVSGGMNINPTGDNGWGAHPQGPTGGPGNYNYGTSANPNPTGPTTSMNPAGSPAPNNPFGLPQAPGGGYTGEYKKFGDELGKIYGRGVGAEVGSFLNTGAGYNGPLTQQSIDAEIQAMQHQAQTGAGNIESNLGASGVSPNSSTAALEMGDYWSNVTAQENAITAQEYFTMWNDSMNRETSILGNIMDPAAQHKASQPGLMDFLNMGVNAAGTALSAFGL
jgi:hypothetical protein